MTPTARTLEYFRDRGYVAGVVERWIPEAYVRKDLFGYIDLIAMSEHELIGVQATDGSNLSSHRKKILEIGPVPEITYWLKHGQIQIFAWRKLVNKDPLSGKWWNPIIEHVDLEYFDVSPGEEE